MIKGLLISVLALYLLGAVISAVLVFTMPFLFIYTSGLKYILMSWFGVQKIMKLFTDNL